MRTGSVFTILLALTAAAMLVMAGCTTTPAGNQTTTATTVPAGNATPAVTANVTANMTANATSNASVTNASTVNITAPFVNATWRWIGQAGSETLSVSSSSQYTIAFNANGTYNLKADCNTGFGNYTLNGTKLSIAPAALTKAYCGDNSLDKRYLAALGRVTSYVMDAEGHLVLIMISPNERMIFEKVKLASPLK